MLRSMTGFGRGEAVVTGKRITVEIKSVNHRYCEVAIRLPRIYSALEEKIRRTVQARVFRGRLDVFVNVVQEGEKTALVKVDKELAMAYYNSLRELGELLQISPEITAEQLSHFPGVLVLQEEEDDLDILWSGLEVAINLAMDNLLEMRVIEGNRLNDDIIHRIGKIEQFINEISVQEPKVVNNYRERLSNRVRELINDQFVVDESRLATEVAVFAERCNITEELVRLNSHLTQFRQLINSDDSIGRKLDFLVQELHREANTIGSKANDAEISHLVVEIKSELEKIREQIQNIE
ncbi:MAG: YicC family protein [Syntrophomonadaceae bacterium]|nr:YicC family protein [Syntrophomonadaceae bacterium]